MRGASFENNANGKCVLFVRCQRELGSGFIQLWERKKINRISFPCQCFMLNHLQKYIVSMLAFRLFQLFPKFPVPYYWPFPSKSNSIVKCEWETPALFAVLVDRSKCRRNWCKSAVHFSEHLWWTALWNQSTQVISMSIFNRVVNVHTWSSFLPLFQEYNSELICRQPLNSNWIKGSREQLDCDRNYFGQFQIRFILRQFTIWESDYNLLPFWTPRCTSIE